ncbi:MAG: ATP-binding protein [Betaproteobacteria bacterium]|nr:ATP-binding protein [Betaproteobacteria bacterium]
MIRSPAARPTAQDPTHSAILTEQTRLLYDSMGSAVVSHLIAGSVFAMLMWQAVPRAALLVWIAILAATTTLRAVTALLYRRSPTREAAMSVWRGRFRIGAALSGVTWALAPLALFPETSVPHQVLLALTLGGLTAGAITSLAMDLVTALLFVVPPLLALAARLLFEGGELAYKMSFLVILFFVFILASARRTQRRLGENVALRARAEAHDAELTESEARLREAQRIARIGYWSLDMRNNALNWSDEVYSIFGRDPASFGPDLGRYYAELVHPDDVAAVRKAMQSVARGDDRLRIDHRVSGAAGGGERWVHVEGLAELDASGRLRAVRGTVQDVTERRQTELELVRAKEVAERASKAKSTFLSNMSHELRTPMNSILGFSQLLEQDASLGSEQREFIGKVHKAGEHLLSLVNDVLDLARVEAGGITLHPDDHDVALLLDDCNSLAAPLAVRHAVTIVISEPPSAETGPVYVRTDITRLRQVLLNLISNAIKYSPRESEITVSARVTSEGALRVEVTDRGPGIPLERQAELFVPFNRLGAERGKIEGSGIGLALAKSLIELMGGHLDFESEPGKGSRFWIELPAVVSLEEASPQAERVGDSGTQSQPNKRYLILYIEDNPANLVLVESILRKHRPACELLTATEPVAGIALARSRVPHLILLDVALPEMNGYDVVRHLREMPETLDIPVVGVSANAMQSDIERGFAAGFDDYVTKPIDITRFLDVVEKWLR